MKIYNEDVAISRAAKLRQLIEYHNDLYYNKDRPEISDAAYDGLVRELETIEAAYPVVYAQKSPTRHVGGTAQSSFADVTHIVPLLSLRDVFQHSEVDQWVQSVEQVCGKNPRFVVEDKVDGLSLAVTYVNGYLTAAATRGDGVVGEDVTENAKQIDSIPFRIPHLMNGLDSKLVVRCEVIMELEQFASLNQTLEEEGKTLFKNPRNAAAGSLRNKNPEITKARHLDAIAFCVLYAEGIPDIKKSQSGDIELLRQYGFKTVDCTPCETQEDIVKTIKHIDETRLQKTYAIDGAVIKCDSMENQAQLGETNKYPRWAVAYKYPPEQKKTVIRNIITQTGRTGVITPVAVFDPVNLCGTMVGRATLHNQSYIDNVLGSVCVGDTVVVHKSGEIIPEILKVVRTLRPADAVPFTISSCPTCGAPAVPQQNEANVDGVAMVCSNENCPAKLSRHIEFWCSKRIMDIDGMGPTTVDYLVSSGAVASIDSIYQLTLDTLAKTPAIGRVRGEKLINAIQASKAYDIDRLIAGLGIPGVGRTIGAELAKRYQSISEIAHASVEELTAIENIGPKSAAAIVSYFQSDDNIRFLERLEALGVNMTSLSSLTPFGSPDGHPEPFTGMTFVITGTLSTLTREQAKDLILTHGGKVTGSVSKKTSYVVAGDSPGSKLSKAQDLGIPILNESQFVSMLS